MKILLTVILILSGITAYATLPKDTIFLFKGQVVMGEILGLQDGILQLDATDMTTLKIKLYKIKRIQSARPFRIVTIDKVEYYGHIQPTDSNGNIAIVLNDSTFIPVPLVYINELIPLEKNFFKQLHGNVGLGFSYTKSKSIGQINLNAGIDYKARILENQFTASGIASIDSFGFSRDYENVSLLSIYKITPSWFGAGGLAYQRNLELSLARRFQEMIGGGNKLLVKKNLELLFITGLAFNQEKSVAELESPLLLEVPGMLQFTFFQFSHPNIQIKTSQTVFVSLTQKGRVRYTGSTSIAWEIVNDFDFTVNPYNNFDNQPSSGGNTFDFGISFGLSYKL